MKTYTDRKMKYTSIEPDSYLVGYDKYNKPIFTDDIIFNICYFFGIKFEKIIKGYHKSDSELKQSIRVTDEEFINFANYFNPFNYLEKNRIIYKPIIGDAVELLSHRYKGTIINAEDIIYVDVQYKNFIDKHLPIYELRFEENIKRTRRNKLNKITES